jgi:diguanylate cyclase (GGDEF)-like protein
MRFGRSAQLNDPGELRFRTATVKTGSWMTFAISAAGCAYYAATWDEPHRGGLLALTLGAVVWGIIVLFLPVERIVGGRWRETFFMSWTTAMIGVILGLVVLDSRARTPLALPLFMPLLFAGLSYPRRVATAVAVLVPSSYVGVALLIGEDIPYAGLFALSLTCSASMCLWQAANRERQRQELDRMSRTDGLTDALNRRGFDERLRAELGEAKRNGSGLTLVIFDLDDFKAVNDNHGHATGDELLCRVVERLQAELRPMDALGRIGGDEFAVILTRLRPGDGRQALERLRRAVAEEASASVGHSSFPEDGGTMDELYRRADAALYERKRSSRLGRHGNGVPSLHPAAHQPRPAPSKM